MRRHLRQAGFATVLFAVMLLSFLAAGFMDVCVVRTSGADSVDTQSESGQQQPMSVMVVGNQSFLQLGEGLSIQLDPSLGKTVGNTTVYDPDVLRTLPVPLIIEYNNLEDEDSVCRMVTALGGVVNMTYTQLPFVAATVPAENVSSLSNGMVSVTPFSNVKVCASLNESVPLIKPPAEWSSLEQQVGESINGTGVTIAIVDTGIDASHPDFYFDNGTSKITYSTSVVPGEDAEDGYGHGTNVAGIAAGTGAASNYTFVGVAPGASLYNIKVLDNSGEGYESWVIAGIELAVNHTASIINLSLGSDVNTDGTDPLSLACDWAVQQGVVVVVAAGNDGPGDSTVGTPGCAQDVITVGASTKQDEMADFSSCGPTYDFRIKPDVVAPGVNITAPAAVGSYLWNYLEANDPSAIVDNYYYTLSGTSMATPFVAGEAALLIELHPTWTPDMIKAAIMNTAQDLNATSYEQGSGRINAYLAATTPVLAINSSLSFGLVQAGTTVLNTTIYNVMDTPETIEAASTDTYQMSITGQVSDVSMTYQMSDNASVPFVSTDLSPPVTIPPGGSVEAGVILNLPQDAPSDYYDGALTLNVSDTSIRVPYNFVYESIIIAQAFWGNISLNANFFAYNLYDTTQFVYPAGSGAVAAGPQMVVPSGTYVVHAMDNCISSGEEPSNWTTLTSMFLLTDIVSVQPGTVTNVNMSLDMATCINVTDTGVDGRAFSTSNSDRDLSFYANNTPYIELGLSGPGTVESLYLSDTAPQEDIYFNMVVYVPGTSITGTVSPGYNDADAETSDAFYSLSWLFNGVNSTTPTSLTCDQEDTVKYTLLYKTDGSPINGVWVAYLDFAPDPSGQLPLRVAMGTGYDIYSGVVRNLYVKYVDWNWNDSSKRELVQPMLFIGGEEAAVSDLNPPEDQNKTIVYLVPPYQTHLTVQTSAGQTSCNYFINMVDEPVTTLWAGSVNIAISCNGVQVPWSGAGPEAFNFSSVEDGVYVINATSITGLTLWNTVEALAQFTVPSIDENPPCIACMNVNPMFGSNDSSLQVSFNASDDVGVQNATLWYSFDYSGNWTSACLTQSGDSFEASVPLTDQVQNVSVRIKVYDDSNNSVQYTISPVSTRGSVVTLSAPATVYLAPGELLWPVPLTASDSSLSTYALQFYENGSFIGNVVVIGGTLGGYFLNGIGYVYYAPNACGDVVFSYVQDMSATYYSSSAQTIVQVGWPVTFDQNGVGSDYGGTVLIVDGTAYGVNDLPVTFYWGNGTIHTFAYESALSVPAAAKQYDWNSTTGSATLQSETLQSDSINVTGRGSVTANYVTHVHDVAVTNVTADRTWVYQGRTANVNVTVWDNGDFPENVTVTLYYNITGGNVVGVQNVTLLSGQNVTLTFAWNTVGVPVCYTNYTLTAVATIPADYTPADNTLQGGNMTVRFMGDINGDGKVDIIDIHIAALAYGSRPGMPNWNPDADVNGYGKIDIRDIALIAKNYGQHSP